MVKVGPLPLTFATSLPVVASLETVTVMSWVAVSYAHPPAVVVVVSSAVKV